MLREPRYKYLNIHFNDLNIIRLLPSSAEHFNKDIITYVCRFKQRQNAPLGVLYFKSFSAVSTLNTSFQKRKNAPVSVLVIKCFSVDPTSKTLFQIAPEYTFISKSSKQFPLPKHRFK